MPSRGGMEAGIGPAVSLDTKGVRPPVSNSVGDGRQQAYPNQGSTQAYTNQGTPQLHAVQELKVALPPVTAPVERVIPIQVEGGRTVYNAQSSVSGRGSPVPTGPMARVTLEEKVRFISLKAQRYPFDT
jgi:hypothetical protein